MGQTRSCSRRFLDRISSIRSYIADMISPLAPIAKAVSELQCVEDFRQGLGQISRVPSFLLDAEKSKQTRALIYNAFLSNIPNYLFVVAMYRRLMNIFYEDSPRIFSYALEGLDTAIILTLLLRLYVRRLVDNSLYTLSLPRAISNDTEEYLVHTVSQKLSSVVSKSLSDIFSMHDISDKIYSDIVKKMQNLFNAFVKKSTSQESFNDLQIELSQIFLEAIKKVEYLKVSTKIALDVASLFAKSIVEEYAGAILKKPKQDIEKSLEKTKGDLVKTFSTVLVQKRADELATNLFNGIACSRKQVQSFLPAKHFESCNCAIKKVVHASLSRSLYFSGNKFITEIPEYIEALGFSSKYLTQAKILCYVLRALLNGQDLMETKLSAAGMCTRHRYWMASRNKARLIGEGAAYLLNVEFVAFACYLYFGVDDAFTRHAIQNMLMLLHLIPTFAFNEPLPGKKQRPLDVFLPARKATYWLASALKSWILPDFKNKDAREDCLRNIKSTLTADLFHSANFVLLGPSQFLPFREIKLLRQSKVFKKHLNTLHPSLKSIKDVASWEETTRKEIDSLLGSKKRHTIELEELMRGEESEIERKRALAERIMLMEATKDLLDMRGEIIRQKNPLRVLCNIRSVKLFVKLFENDINAGVGYGELGRRISPWLIKPLSILPSQGIIISMIEVPLNLLNEAALEEIIRQVKEQLAESRFLTKEFDAPKREAKYFEPPVISAAKPTKEMKCIEFIKDDKSMLPDLKRAPNSGLDKISLSSVTVNPPPVTMPLPIISACETKMECAPPFVNASDSPHLLFGKSGTLKVVEEPNDLKEERQVVPALVIRDSLLFERPQKKPKTTNSIVAGLKSFGVWGIVSNLTGQKPSTKSNKKVEGYELRSFR